MIRVNLGSGPREMQGWINYDNSFSLYLSRLPRLVLKLIYNLKIVNKNRYSLILSYKNQKIIWANIVKTIPEKDNSIDLVYLSHVIEHLDSEEIELLFKEILRIMKPSGILRISVPDISILVNDYLKSGDADKFIERTMLSNGRPKKMIEKLQLLLVGTRNHQWMYDEKSLKNLLIKNNFRNIKTLKAGNTTISNIDGLDLFERDYESLYIECLK
jgi:predicted SAM-dependent methyltransferase